jgi:hypothetical protein
MGEVSQLEERLLKEHGPLMSGAALQRALGFRTAAAFKKALRNGHLHLNVFHIEGRRGLFCLTSDVAGWLERVASQPASQTTQKGGNGMP